MIESIDSAPTLAARSQAYERFVENGEASEQLQTHRRSLRVFREFFDSARTVPLPDRIASLGPDATPQKTIEALEANVAEMRDSSACARRAEQAAAELAVRGSGRIEKYRAAERQVTRLIDGIEWFANTSRGVHGITLRDFQALRLLATWAALAVLMRDQLEPEVNTTLVRPFHLQAASPSPMSERTV